MGQLRGQHAQRVSAAGRPLIAGGALLVVCGAALVLAPGGTVTADTGSALLKPATTALLPGASAAPSPAPSPSPTVDLSFVPDRLVVGAVDIDAPLLATPVDDEGALVPPEDPAELGWWRGVRPGSGTGSVIVAGHLDSRRYGQGPLARLVDLAPGDTAVVTGPDGVRREYVLRGVQTYPKDQLPATELFGYDGPERLVLVTCGGTFDRSRGGWDSNVVAVLDPATPA